jgi:hypothetical protein
MKDNSPMLKKLLQRQAAFLKQFNENPLMQLIVGQETTKQDVRRQLLDSLQVFSDYFQKAVMLRAVFTEQSLLFKMAQEHLHEEFGHNTSLSADRGHRPTVFDPILESTTSWFCWKMLTLDRLEKTVLMHWVLEASAYSFFTEAHKVMQIYKETDYFKVHAEADEYHKELDTSFLEGLSDENYANLLIVLEQSWQILFTACGRIAELSIRVI